MTDRNALRQQAEERISTWEKRVRAELDRLWERQEGVVLARLTGAKARKNTRHWESRPGGFPITETKKLDAGYVVDPLRWTAEGAELLRELFTAMMTLVFGRTYAALNAKVPEADQVVDTDSGPSMPAELDDKMILDLIAARLQRRLDLISRGVQTASSQVAHVIAEGDAAGKPIDEIAADVRATYDAHRDTWTDRIATTNVVGALNEASIGGADAAGVEHKQWLSAHDTRVRPTHRAADGQVVPITAKFHLGGIPEHPVESWLEFPGDPTGPSDEVINCRCTMLFPLDMPSSYASGQIPFADSEFETAPTGALDFEDKSARHVRTPAGARMYGQPIGALIVADTPDAKVDWVSPAELDAHHGAYETDPSYREHFDAWYSHAYGEAYEAPTAKYSSHGGSSLWVYADGHGSAKFTGKAGVAEDKTLTPDEVTALLAKGAFHAHSSGHHATLSAAPSGAYHAHSAAHGPPLVPPTPVEGLPGVTYTDERSPGGPSVAWDAGQLKAAFDLVGIEMTPGLKVTVHLRDQKTAGEQGVTWQSGPNAFEVVVKVTPGAWPEPEGSLYVINNSLLHELRHVRQSQIVPGFQADYVKQNHTVGYGSNKYEVEARLYGHLADPTGAKPVPAGMAPIGKAEWVLGVAA